MGILEVVLIVLVVLFLFGGGYGYSRRTDWGNAPAGVFGLLVLILVVFLVIRLI